MVDDIIKACRNPKIQGVTTIVVLGFVLLLMLFSFDYSIAPHFAYPEEEYKLLEEEAEKILSEGTFDSQYVDTIEYKPANDTLQVTLRTNNASLRINCSEYGEENQSVEIYRMSKGSVYFVGTLKVIILYLLYSGVALLWTIFAFNILEHVCLKIKRRREN